MANALGKDLIKKNYELADVYHSDNIDRVTDDFITAAKIQNGNFDNVSAAKYAVPSHWDIGKVYKRLILGIAKEKEMDIPDALLAAIIRLSVIKLIIITAASIMMLRKIY